MWRKGKFPVQGWNGGVHQMGLDIGNIPNTLSAGRIEVRQTTPARSREETAPQPGAGARGQDVPIGAGFGENTISIPGLTARTIGRNMTDVRKMVPTLDEMRAEQKARAEERRAEALEELEAQWQDLEENAREPIVRIDFQRAEAQARAQTRQFDNTSAPAAPESPSRVAGAKLPVPTPKTPPESAGGAIPFSPPAAMQFDLRV